MDAYVLGLDLGANSCGWAMINLNPTPDAQNIIAGVRIFPEGTLKEKENEKPRNQNRREARQRRRQLDRRARRKRKLGHILRAHGIHSLQHKRRQKTGKPSPLPCPYQLRKKALDEELSLSELGFILMHLNQRRGFKSNAKTDNDKETGAIFKGDEKLGKTGITELESNIRANDARTLGEYFAGLNPHETRIRNTYTLRAMYEQEFETIWAKQTEFHPKKLTPALREKVYQGLFDQRPLKSQAELIGKCPLETKERRAPRASWLAHRFRILQTLNDIRILEPRRPERPLEDAERDWMLEQLHAKATLSYSAVRKKLGFGEGIGINFERSQKDKLGGNPVEAGIRNIFKEYEKEPDKIHWLCTEVFDALIDLDPDEFETKARDEWDLSEDQIKALFKIKRPSGYMAYSRKALERLIPFMEDGQDRLTAIQSCEYHDPDLEVMDLLPPIPEDMTNPVVKRALAETRKVVNLLIREYGKPQKIVIEMARETKGTIESRSEQTKELQHREKLNEQIRTQLREANVPANRENVIKWKLWKECGEQCPYTGKKIGFDPLFRVAEFQIEHILPRDRSHDNSYMNLTLCHQSENLRKGMKTPHEAYHGTPQYDEIQDRLRDMKAMPFAKKKRFSVEEISEEFVQRQLQDTSFIARAVVQYLKHLDVNVATTRGAVTAELRHQWGLFDVIDEINNGLEATKEANLVNRSKNRNDHRHHAIDAIAVALTNMHHVQMLASRYRAQQREPFASPWEKAGMDRNDFRHAVLDAIAAINVSFRPERQISGQLFAETNYGRLSNGKYVKRVKAVDLSDAQIGKIVDATVKRLVQNALEQAKAQCESKGESFTGAKRKEALSNLKMPGEEGPAIRKVRVAENKTVVFPIKDEQGQVYRYLESAENHHFSVYEYTDSEGAVKRCKDFVSRAEAVRRQKAGEPVVRRQHPEHPDARFLFSLCKNDMVNLLMRDGSTRLCRVQKFSDLPSPNAIDMSYRLHTDAHQTTEIDNKVKTGEWSSVDKMLVRPRILTLDFKKFKAEKISVDPIGRIRRAND